jgi:hypothetical protein
LNRQVSTNARESRLKLNEMICPDSGEDLEPDDSRYELKSIIHPLHYLEPTMATHLLYVHESAMLA